MVLSMDRWVGKVAVVTGASAGCGAAIAQQLVQAGLEVVGLARRVEKIQQLANKLEGEKGKLHALKTDMTIEADIVAAFKWIEKHFGPVHILVNNAGISQPTNLTAGNAEMWENILKTNVLGLSIATREAIRSMETNEIDGQIVHINSMLGHYVLRLPNANMYTASKFAVTALTETLRQELMDKGSKIKITSVSPGPVDTEFASANNLHQCEDYIKVYESLPKLSAEDVADAVSYVLSTPHYVQVQDVLLRPLGENV